MLLFKQKRAEKELLQEFEELEQKFIENFCAYHERLDEIMEEIKSSLPEHLRKLADGNTPKGNVRKYFGIR